MPELLHPCNHRDWLSDEADCDQPARLYMTPAGKLSWICDVHAFPIEDLLKAVR